MYGGGDPDMAMIDMRLKLIIKILFFKNKKHKIKKMLTQMCS
jgi:hypothetical protein